MIRAIMLGGVALAALAADPALAQVAGPPAAASTAVPDATSSTAPVRGQVSTRRLAVVPYIEVGQNVFADLNSGDVLTYSTLAAGVDVAADSNRVSGQLSYRYEHRIGWGDDVGDANIHSGLARVDYRVTPEVTLEAGGIATRSRYDIRGAAPGLLVGDVDNISQVYSVYAGPTLATHAGPVAIGASYVAGYTKVNVPNGGTGVDPSQPRADYFDDSLTQSAAVSAGVRPGAVLPVGLTASAGYDRADAGQLDQRYEGYRVRGDVLAPVSPYVAVTGGLGYERIETSQRAAVVDATGIPVVDRNGRFVTDHRSPRQITYRTDGIYYDVGVVWRPNPRLNAEAHVGKRYGSVSYTGLVTYQASRNVGFAADVYDTVTTFGQQLRTGLSNLPTSFIAARDTYTQQYNGCVFATSGSAPGGCLNDVFQSISTASYRARGVDALISATSGRSTFGGGVGYTNRKLYNRDNVPGVTLYGIEDESYYAQGFYSRELTPLSSIAANIFVNYYDPGFRAADNVVSYGGSANYGRSFGRLSANLSAGLYSFDTSYQDAAWTAQAQVAARYSF